MIPHSTLSGDQLHGPFRVVFADAAAVAADVGPYVASESIVGGGVPAIALQADTNSVFILRNHSPVTWVSPFVAAASPPVRGNAPQITADQDDYDCGGLLGNTTSAIVLDLDADWTITGFASAGIDDGRVFKIVNGSAHTLVLAHESMSSAQGNRIAICGAADLEVPSNGSVDLMLDKTMNGWRIT